MFYHQSILQRRGQFGIIWLAATEISKVKRREITSVNLYRTCQNIMDYILVRVHPSGGGSRPRFSLYLSAQLMFGVVRVYKNQSQYLLEELTSFLLRVHKATVAEPADIDMKDVCRPGAVTCFDFAELSSENQVGFDPFFGCLKDSEELSDFSCTDPFPWFGDQSSLSETSLSSPEVKKSASSRSSRSRSTADQPPNLQSVLGSPHTVTNIDEITMKEPSFTLPQPDMQEEMINFDGSKLDIIQEEPLDLAKYFAPIPVPTEEEQTVGEQREVLSPKEKTPAPAGDMELPRVLRPRQPPPLSPGVTPAPEISEAASHPRRQATLTLELGPPTPSPSRRRKRRHLAIDQEIKLTKNQLRENLADTSDILRDYAHEIPNVRLKSVEDLLQNPARPIIKQCFSNLWNPRLKHGLNVTESDSEIPCWTVPDLREEGEPPRKRRALVLPEPEIPLMAPTETEMLPQAEVSAVPVEELSVEMARDASMLSRSRQLDTSKSHAVTPVSIRHSLLSEHDKSVSDESSIQKESARKKPVSSRCSTRSKGSGISSEEEIEMLPREQLEISGPIQDFSAAELSTVAEEQESQLIHQVFPHVEIDGHDSNVQKIIRQIDSKTQDKMYTTFDEVCPTTVHNRRTAVSMFTTLLNLCAAHTVEARQDRCFGPIRIKRGPNW